MSSGFFNLDCRTALNAQLFTSFHHSTILSGPWKALQIFPITYDRRQASNLPCLFVPPWCSQGLRQSRSYSKALLSSKPVGFPYILLGYLLPCVLATDRSRYLSKNLLKFIVLPTFGNALTQTLHRRSKIESIHPPVHLLVLRRLDFLGKHGNCICPADTPARSARRWKGSNERFSGWKSHKNPIFELFNRLSFRTITTANFLPKL